MTADVALMQVDAGLITWAQDKPDAADEWRAAYGVLDMARMHSGAEHAALFARTSAGTLRLVAVRGIDQAGLDLVHQHWHVSQRAVSSGRLWSQPRPPTLLLPCLDGRVITGAALLRWPPNVALDDLPGLASLAQVLGSLLRRLAGRPGEVLLAATQVGPGFHRAEPAARTEDALQRATLRALLEDHEWNVSRVARVLGVTRMTVYNRLHRLGMERVRVFKTGLARRCADSVIADVGPASADDSTGLPEEARDAPLTGADDGLAEGAQ